MNRSGIFELVAFFRSQLPSPKKILSAYSLALRTYGLRAISLTLGYLSMRFKAQIEPKPPFDGRRVSGDILSGSEVEQATITVIIPTRDELDLLRSCVDSVLSRTANVEYEVCIVDNGSIRETTLRYLNEISKESKVFVVRDDGDFNFSRLNNLVAKISRSQYLCLLNNDTKIIDPQWLSKMVALASHPKVGAVGTTLLYEDGTIQHSGVAIGRGGIANHFFRAIDPKNPAAELWLAEPRKVSAVTGACLVIKAEKFAMVGGLDERLAVGFNDVDLCLKLSKAGFINILASGIEIFHFESKSRGTNHKKRFTSALDEVLQMMSRWGKELKRGENCF